MKKIIPFNNILDFKTDVKEIKDDVKNLTAKPAKRWENVIDTTIKLIIGGVVTYCLTHLGL